MGPPDPERRFEEIYTAHYPDLLAYVRRRTVSPDDAAALALRSLLPGPPRA
ncbi:hypothetical protein [Planomonospora venezuelensis]|uniref:DNA-directed RNA polymerase specialized sigma24 family protein n=1 Tax=Planomonospora venezuelensis TaxID=1999 RepID=A0A841DB64_PLAVE|nr:hypothetical protein [Planomonospora venezuelensis]MBB5965355.1 DNA-directed RNA polymerase specialized sigma24 family protein [Planomonospora venezuelensis]GIN05613.1 hypothetical protein Pve01_72710 [Planomonospora venezuelensis]